MDEYFVVYTEAAEDQLLDLFVASPDRRAFEDASHALERRLATDPWSSRITSAKDYTPPTGDRFE